MQPTIGYAQQDILKSLVVATIISLLCVSAFAIYLWSAKEPLEVILLLLAAPSILHAISFALLLQRPGTPSGRYYQYGHRLTWSTRFVPASANSCVGLGNEQHSNNTTARPDLFILPGVGALSRSQMEEGCS